MDISPPKGDPPMPDVSKRRPGIAHYTSEPMAATIKHHPFLYFLGLVLVMVIVIFCEESDKKHLRLDRAQLQEQYYDLVETTANLKVMAEPNLKFMIKYSLSVYGSDIDWRVISGILWLERHYTHFGVDGKVIRVPSKVHPNMEFVGAGCLLLPKGTKYTSDGVDVTRYEGTVHKIVQRIVLMSRKSNLRVALSRYGSGTLTYADRVMRLASRIQP